MVRRKKTKVKTAKCNPKKTSGGTTASNNIDNKFRKEILNKIVATTEVKALKKTIRTLYEKIISAITDANSETIGRTNAMPLNEKNIIDNFIEYAESANFKKEAKAAAGNTNVDWDSNRETFIDQFTRFNTKPYFDPYVDRIVSTFWPEFDSIRFKPSRQKTLKKTTKFVSDFYDNVPIYEKEKKNADDTNADNRKKPGTYSHRVLRQYEDYKGDKLLTDAFGVEETINMLMQTGSNLSWAEARLPTYTEEYQQDEKYDVSKMIPLPEIEDEDEKKKDKK